MPHMVKKIIKMEREREKTERERERAMFYQD